ncbi:MAG TPA: SurA N-terminal domain-containing protein [Gammaproteobacteria bacterium]
MLQSIRENIKGVGAWIIVLFLCVPFAFWGISQYFDTNASTSAATVNGEEISDFALEQAYQQRYRQLLQAFGDQLPADLINEQALRSEQLNQLIMEELLRQKMRDAGYRASDEQLRERILSVPAFQENGKFSPELYRQTLSAAGRSPTTFEALLRRDLALEQLQQGVVASEFATPREAAIVMAIEEQGRRHSAVIVPDESFTDAVEITNDDVADYYESNKMRFLTEETVDAAYVELTKDRFAGQIEVSDETLRELYSSRADRYASQEQRAASHILIAGDDEAARAKAEAVLERIQSGEDFAAVAAEVSDDTVSAEEGGSLGLIQRGQLEGAFEEALFSMQEGEISGPVQTDFGFHIIRLDDIKAPELPAFEEIRDELAADYQAEQAQERFEEAVRQLADAAFRDDGSLGTAAEELDLEIQEITDVKRNAGPGLAQNAEVREALFSDSVLKDGLNSDPIQLSDEHVVVVRVTDHQPAEPKPLAAVEDQVRQQLRAERATEMARAKANEILERARAGESLADIAATEEFTFRDESVTYRQTPDISAAYAEALFSAEYPVDGPTLAMTPVENNDFVVFQLSEVLPGNFAGLTASEQETRQRTLGQREASVATAAYLAEMRESADVTVRGQSREPTQE